MLPAVLNKSWKQHPTKQQLYDHLSPISQTIQVKQARHAGHCWRSKDKLISNIQLYRLLHMDTPVLADQQKLNQFYVDTGCHLEDLQRAMTDRDG